MILTLAHSGLNDLTTQDLLKIALILSAFVLLLLVCVVVCIVASVRGVQRMRQRSRQLDQSRRGFEVKQITGNVRVTCVKGNHG